MQDWLTQPGGRAPTEPWASIRPSSRFLAGLHRTLTFGFGMNPIGDGFAVHLGTLNAFSDRDDHPGMSADSLSLRSDV
jgi:hypothetical protein